MTTSERFVAVAYMVFLATLLVYVLIHAQKVARLAREVARLEDERETR